MLTKFDKVFRWYFSTFPIERGKWRFWELLRLFVKRDSGLIVERTILYGIRMKLNLAEYVDRFIYYWDCFEPNETWVIKKILRPGDTFVDAGANIGYFTLLAAKIVGPSGRVISVEPVPTTAARLKENVELNRAENIVVYEAAISDKSGLVKIGKAFAGGSATSTMRIKETTEQVWEVPALTLDQILSQERSIRLVKIDVEGAELLALKGFMEHLKSDEAPHVFCEIDSDSFLKDLGGSTKELYSLMTDFGYQAYSCNNLKFTSLTLDAMTKLDGVKVLFSKAMLT